MTPSAFAQVTSGNLAGIVKDSSGAVVAKATVTVTNQDTGISTTTTTNGSGEYLVLNLLSGRYDVTVKNSGFQNYNLKGVVIDTNKTSTSDITLAAATSQSVEVTVDSGVTIDTTSTNLTATYSTEELSTLPNTTSGEGVLNAALLSPGVTSSGGVGIGVGGSIGGQRPRSNNFTIEGIDNNNKAVTGPLIYIPNDSVANFTIITDQFSPEFGHSTGGQFNTTVTSGTNAFHGKLYEYMNNRNLNAAAGVAGGKIFPIPRYDYNRYGGQLGGPIWKDKLFFFGNFERQTTGESLSYYLCTPTAAGLTTLKSLTGYGFNTTNLNAIETYVPAATVTGAGGTGIDAAADVACGNQASGPQYLTVTNNTTGTGTATQSTNIPLGNLLVSAPVFTNFDALTTSMDYTISSKDSLRVRYLYNTEGTSDVAAYLPTFFVTTPYKYHLATISEYHSFTPNLTNEFRIGFNRFANTITAPQQYSASVGSFPNLTFDDQGYDDVGPDGNAPQFTIQNLFQVTDNVSWVKGKHAIKIGFDGRKYISPQQFTQRARGDYEWSATDYFLHDLAPDEFGQRSSGTHTYYGDQTALYGYINDTWRATPTLTINAGLRYEFTSVPVGERTQALNAGSSVAGLISFHAPQPAYTSFAPRVGVNWAPDSKTSVRAGFGVAYDVLFDNLGTLSFPPQLSTTSNVVAQTTPASPQCTTAQTATCIYAFLAPNFLTNGGLPATSSGTLTTAQAIAGTSAYLPNQVVPYAETYSLTVQRTFASNYTAEIGYLGTRGIHLPTQIQLNKQPAVNATNNLYTVAGTTTIERAGTSATNLAAINTANAVIPAFRAAGFTSTITSYQPFSQSSYNALIANLSRRMQHGLQFSASWTWSKTMDDATAEVFATVLTPRRPQNSQCVACDYSRSALDHTHRVVVEAVYNLPFFQTSHNFFLKNGVGNWTVSPIYTYESPEYATALSGFNSNLNGDSGTAIDRPLINPNGVKGTGTGVNPIVVGGQTVGYSAKNPNAYYVAAGSGTLPTVGRNTLPINPINNFDLSLYKRVTIFEHYSVELGAQAYNALNHAQYIPGSVDGVDSKSYTGSYNFQTVSNALFNKPNVEFGNNARTIQVSGKLIF